MLAWIGRRLATPQRATVVFDPAGRGAPWVGRAACNGSRVGVEVAYAIGYANADSFIAEVCQAQFGKGGLVVVSDDGDVRSQAAKCRLRWLGCETSRPS